MAAPSPWQDQYVAALAIRDRREQALKSTYDDCMCTLAPSYLSQLLTAPDAKLADLAASLSKQLASRPDHPFSGLVPTTTTTITTASSNTRPSTASSTTQPHDQDIISGLRTDLASAQAIRTTLTNELASLNTTLTSLQASLTRTSTTANSLAREKALLERKLRDRDEELREKRKMLEGVLDEVVALTMQVNLLEQERDGLREKIG